MGSSGEEIYCICRSSDVNRFMIGCDHCNDWFHGDCIHVSERESKYIKRYFCDECRTKNSNLAIVYSSRYKEKFGEERIKARENAAKKLQKKEDIKRDKKESSSSSSQRPNPSTSSRPHSEKHKHKDKERDKEREKSKEMEERKRLKEKKRAKEKEREVRKEKERKEKEKEKELKRLNKKKEEQKKLELLKKEQEEVKIKEEIKVKEEVKAAASTPPPPPSPKTPLPSPKPPSSTTAVKREVIDSKELKRRKSILSERNVSDGEDEEEDEEEVWRPPPAKERKVVKETKPSKMKKQPPVTKHSRKRHQRRWQRDSTSEEELQVDLTPKQCYGPGCIRSATPNSKYCSDECGMKLATTRILQTLPERIREWNMTPCQGEKLDRKELEKIRAKQEEVTARLDRLNVEFDMLEDIIAKGKTLRIDENDDEDEDEAGEMTIHCVTCGSNIQTLTAIRHMERCYNKIESQTSFASEFKTQVVDHRMFCDYFNPKEQTYCKRLQVLCPEHNPDPKIGDEEACGCPMQKELFSKPSSFCLRAKKTCHIHFSWEKLRRAELDMERVKSWMKVDELIEQERQMKASMSNRAGVLSLMLHSTYNHELNDQWQQQRAQQQRKLLQQQKHVQKPIK